METTTDTITIAVSCEGCGKEMLLNIPLDRVEVEYTVRCPDCGPFEGAVMTLKSLADHNAELLRNVSVNAPSGIACPEPDCDRRTAVPNAQ